MKSNLKVILLQKTFFWIFFWTCFLLSEKTVFAKDFVFTILHTNDLHSHEMSYKDNEKVVGGFARIAYLINKYKQSTPNCLAIDAGDIFQGSPLYTYYHGQCEVDCLNAMHYDIYTIGNHEFDDGPINLAKQLAKAKFDVVNCNLDFSKYKEFDNIVEPYVIKNIAGQKVAFIGAITPEIGQVSITLQNVKVRATDKDWYLPVKNMVSKIKDMGINKIILVTHCGVDLDKELATNIDGIDAIIGGHSHTKLAKPIIIEHANCGPTMIVQTGCYGRYLGVLELAFDDKDNIILNKSNEKLIAINDTIPEDKGVKNLIDQEEQPIDEIVNKEVGFSNVYLGKMASRSLHDYALGDTICDALCEYGAKFGATISFQNRGGTRTSIEKGPITLGAVQSMLPFKNYLVVASITGKSLYNVMEKSYSKVPSGRFFDVHGLKVIYDPEANPNHRIKYLLYQSKDGSYKPVIEDDYYRIILNSYSFDGGEGYDFGKYKDKVQLPIILNQAFLDYLKKHPKLEYPETCRILPAYNFMELKNNSPIITDKDLCEKNKLDLAYLVCSDDIGISKFIKHYAVPLENVKFSKKLDMTDDYKINYTIKPYDKFCCLVLVSSKTKKYFVSYPQKITK